MKIIINKNFGNFKIGQKICIPDRGGIPNDLFWQKRLKDSQIDLKHPSEISLGLHLSRFGEVLGMMSRDLLPNRLTDYLYDLATKFNVFFRDCHVDGTPEQDNRLLLCHLAEKVMYEGFNILGLRPLDRM